MAERQKIVITITRQMASGGSFLARSLAQRMGFRYVDRDILNEAAKVLGTEERELVGREERLSTFWENLMRNYSYGATEVAYVPVPKRPIYDRDLFDAESKVIKEIAAGHDAVIVGRGAFHILKGHPGLVKVFLHAPVDFRLSRLLAVRGGDRDQTRLEIEASDRDKERFMREMTGVNWTDAQYYHLCMDTSVVDFMVIEEMIVQLVEKIRERQGVKSV